MSDKTIDLKVQSDLNLYNFFKGMIYEDMYGVPMPEERRVTYQQYMIPEFTPLEGRIELKEDN